MEERVYRKCNRSHHVGGWFGCGEERLSLVFERPVERTIAPLEEGPGVSSRWNWYHGTWQAWTDDFPGISELRFLFQGWIFLLTLYLKVLCKMTKLDYQEPARRGKEGGTGLYMAGWLLSPERCGASRFFGD
jgi:hypothetical protein